MSLIEVKHLHKSFNGIHAVKDCSFKVETGTITALIGPNGAGKTTAFNLISGVLKPTSGEIWFDGERIDGRSPHKITRRGMSRTFQVSRNLENMTVLENLVVQAPGHGWRGLFMPSISTAERERAMALLEFVGIAHLAYEDTEQLSYGQKKLLDFAALLMSDPKVILLDEPAGGVNLSLLENIVSKIRELNEQGMTVFIVEHNMDLVMSLCDHVIVMAYGELLAEGPPEVVQSNPQVLEAYLGEKAT